MALTIATGFVVDDAIVMIENIARYVEDGDPPLEAALKGSKQIGFTIISLTVSLIAVLIPLLFMGDVVGRLFHEFAITLAVTIVISAVVSLTLVPMLCAKLLRHTPPKESKRFEARAHQFIDYVIGRYAVALTWVLDRQYATLFVALLTLVFTAVLYIVIPKGFFPTQDTGVIQAITQAPQAASYQAVAAAAAGARRADPEESRCREPDVVHRRRRHEHHAEQRPHADQPEAARRPQQHVERRDPHACRTKSRTFRASSSTCSRCRT